MSFNETDFWGQTWALRDAVQEQLDRIKEVYGLEKCLTCIVDAGPKANGELLATVEFPEGEEIDDRLRCKLTGTPRAVSKQVLPILTSLLE